MPSQRQECAMIDHLSTYATDYEATKAFYQAVLPTLGYALNVEMKTEWDPDSPDGEVCAFGPGEKPVLWIAEVDEPATPRHVAFKLEAGGEDNGPPGPRPHYHEHYYGAFVLDPDGNNVEAVCHAPAGAD